MYYSLKCDKIISVFTREKIVAFSCELACHSFYCLEYCTELSFGYRVAFNIFSVIILCFSFVNHKNQNNGCRVIYQLRVHLHGRVKKAWPLASSSLAIQHTHHMQLSFNGGVCCCHTMHITYAILVQWTFAYGSYMSLSLLTSPCLRRVQGCGTSAVTYG